MQAATIAQVLTVPPPTAVGTFVTFDVPRAVNGTFPASINNGGVITGTYGDNLGSGSHGFVRAANGTFTTFDVPGAATGTFPSGINNGGDTTGSYCDVNSVCHGFVRAANGTFTTFDVPGGALFFNAAVINPEGAVTGSYFDANFIPHSFLRDPKGTLTTFDAPGAVNGTFPNTITPDGVILGVYTDASSIDHGFLRARSGAFTEINGPGGLTGQTDFLSSGPALSINPRGVITGTYFEPIAVGNPFGGNFRVFVLSPDGAYETFDAANYPPCCIWSAPSGINPAGTITGSFNDGFNINHGFLRTSDGTIATFDVPGAGTGELGFQGTLPLGITPAGVIMGHFVDAKIVTHGFLFLPQRAE